MLSYALIFICILPSSVCSVYKLNGYLLITWLTAKSFRLKEVYSLRNILKVKPCAYSLKYVRCAAEKLHYCSCFLFLKHKN